MFAYCLNNPTNCCDPSGHATFWTSTGDVNPFLSGYFGTGGGAGGGSNYSGAGIAYRNPAMWHTDPSAVRESLCENGITFYKGALVMSFPLPVDRAAFSFGIIVMDDYFKEDAKDENFNTILNHEYGHTVHFSQVGVAAYAATVALPSLVGAGLSYVVPWVKNNYYSLPWEHIANQLGGVENIEYLPGANKASALYWVFTQAVNIGLGVLT